MDRLFPTLQASMAFADLFQVPLVLAIVYSIALARRWGRAWKGIGVAFAAYTLWVIATTFLVGFSPSGYVVLGLGVLLCPAEPRFLASLVLTRLWVCGILGTTLALWAIPTGAAWLLRRRGASLSLQQAPRSWRLLAIGGLLLFASQQLLFIYANRPDPGARPGEPYFGCHPLAWGVAAAATLPIIALLATAMTRWLRCRRSIAARPTGP